jgi:hypothetical protein
MAIALRWLSLPFAACVAIASIWSLWSEYRRTEHLIPTTATVIEARVLNTSRVTTEWDAYVRYRLDDRDVENSVRVWTPFDLDQGDTIGLLVDPASGEAQDDLLAMSWAMAIAGVLAALFMVLVGFRLTGAMLRRYVA